MDPEFLSIFFFSLVTFVLSRSGSDICIMTALSFVLGAGLLFFTLLFISFVTLGPGIDRLFSFSIGVWVDWHGMPSDRFVSGWLIKIDRYPRCTEQYVVLKHQSNTLLLLLSSSSSSLVILA